jgi:hypothetical protein
MSDTIQQIVNEIANLAEKAECQLESDEYRTCIKFVEQAIALSLKLWRLNINLEIIDKTSIIKGGRTFDLENQTLTTSSVDEEELDGSQEHVIVLICRPGILRSPKRGAMYLAPHIWLPADVKVKRCPPNPYTRNDGQSWQYGASLGSRKVGVSIHEMPESRSQYRWMMSSRRL